MTMKREQERKAKREADKLIAKASASTLETKAGFWSKGFDRNGRLVSMFIPKKGQE